MPIRRPESTTMYTTVYKKEKNNKIWSAFSKYKSSGYSFYSLLLFSLLSLLLLILLTASLFKTYYVFVIVFL